MIKVYITARDRSIVDVWGELPHYDPGTGQWLGVESITVNLDEGYTGPVPDDGDCLMLTLNPMKAPAVPGNPEIDTLMFAEV